METAGTKPNRNATKNNNTQMAKQLNTYGNIKNKVNVFQRDSIANEFFTINIHETKINTERLTL
jgi:hypothetical protein